MGITEGKRLLGRSRFRWHVLLGEKYVQGFGWVTEGKRLLGKSSCR